MNLPEIPKIDVDVKIVIALAAIALIVSFVVYQENKKLKSQMTIVRKPCNCDDKDAVIPVEEGPGVSE